jgi:hypothetical protein
MRFTPGWSVGWFFVPILNLFKPYQAMKEIWLASMPSDETPWPERKAPPVVGWWWILWLIAVALGLSAYWLTASARSTDELLTASWTLFAADAVEIPLAIVAIVLVRGIHEMQERRRAAMASD